MWGRPARRPLLQAHGSRSVGFAYYWCPMQRRFAILTTAVLLVAASANSQPAIAQFDDDGFGSKTKRLPKDFFEIADITAEVVPAKAKRGETVTFKITVSPKIVGAWTYPNNPSDPEQTSKNDIRLPKDPGAVLFVEPVSDPKQPKPHEKPRNPAKKDGLKDQYYNEPVTWEFPMVVSPNAKPGEAKVGLDKFSRIEVCTDQTCLFTNAIPTATLEILDGDMPINPAFKDAVEKLLNPKPPVTFPNAVKGQDFNVAPNRTSKSKQTPTTKIAKSLDDYQAGLDSVLKQLDANTGGSPEPGVGKFILTAMVWGLISLVTPCVFPMIPITVSIFLKHAQGSFRERMKLAGVYCLTIIVVLGLSAFVLLKFMAWLSTHPVTNILLGLLFVVLALSLFGMYELTLPNFLSRRLQAKQAKGGAIGTIFGALAFTVISFTCVAPFLGGFAGISAADSGSGDLISLPTTKEVFGGLAFATAFAAPFFVLAMIPGLLKTLPKSGGWLDSVKVVMGFLELAAALKFFRTAELRSPYGMSYFTYDVVLAGWVAISFACGLYLLNAYRLPHDEEKPNIGVPRLIFALLFLGLGVYLLPGIFKGPDGNIQRPKGAVFAWVDAFLLPEPKPKTNIKGDDKELVWGTDLKDALDRVRNDADPGKNPRPIFIDFTGKTCTNCRLNEENVFPLPEVQNLFREFERVQLYTDELPAELYASDPGFKARVLEARANGAFESAKSAFGTAQLPLYVILLPQSSGKIIARVYPEGAINEPAEFITFLKKGLGQIKE
jgi:thiol:disulfide interchange protein